MSESSKAYQYLDAMILAIRSGKYCVKWDDVAVENLINDLADVQFEVKELPDYKTLHDLAKSLDERVSKMETMVEGVAKEVGPIVAELAGSPIIKMLTGGKNRG